VRPHEHHEVGVNSRLDEIQAGVLRVKLRHLDRWNERRRANAETYGRLLSGLPLRPPHVRTESKHVFSSYVVEVKEGERDRVRTALEDRGVGTGVQYPIPIHQQPAMRAIGRVAGDLRVTEGLCRRTLSLPMFGELEPEQLAYVATCLEDCLASQVRMPATA
jgi:dTDP-4-amino-4,6-dideoxygalactose transaminase